MRIKLISPCIVKWKLIITDILSLLSLLCNFTRREITYTRLISYRSWFFHNGMCQPSHVTRANICRIYNKNTFQWHAPCETQTATKFIPCTTISVCRIVLLYIYYVPVPLSDADVDYILSTVK